MKKLSRLLCLLVTVSIYFACNNGESVSNQAEKMAKEVETTATKVANTVSAAVKSGGYKIGDQATDFRLMGVDGEMVSLKDYTDAKGFIVTFTCNTCPYAVMYEDRLIDLHQKYASKGYPVIAINPNDPSMKPGDSFEKMKLRAKEKSFPFPYLFDADQNIFPKYGATRTPHVFLLDKALNVRYIGAIDDNAQDAGSVKNKYVENAISALEMGKDPSPDFTKAVGCGIKYKKS